MIFKCKCGQKIRLRSVPTDKVIQFDCPKCGLKNTIEGTKDEDLCIVCNKLCQENNVLQNGRKFHDRCFSDLKSYKTEFDSEINNYESQIKKLIDLLADYLDEERDVSLFIDNFDDDYTRTLKRKISILKLEVSDLQTQKNNVLRDRKKKLKTLYDYWLTRPPDWEERSSEVRNKKNRCEDCGKLMTIGTSFHVHHKVPISHGGNHKKSNLELLCSECHQDKHSFEIDSFLEDLDSNQKSHYKSLVETVEESVSKNKYLKFKYRRYEGVRDKHLVKVMKFLPKKDGMYFKGFCHLSNSVREFKLKNMYKVELLSNLPNSKLPSEYIDEALENDLLIYYEYVKRNGDLSLRSFKPKRYKKFKGVNVIEGYDYLTNEIRSFAPNRMSKIELIDQPKESKVITGKP